MGDGADGSSARVVALIGLAGTLGAAVIAGVVALWAGYLEVRGSADHSAEIEATAQSEQEYRSLYTSVVGTLPTVRDQTALGQLRKLQLVLQSSSESALRGAILQTIGDHVRRRMPLRAARRSIVGGRCQEVRRTPLPVDVQLALYLIGHRSPEDEDTVVDLSYSDLYGAKLALGNYRSVNFEGSTLTSADFAYSVLGSVNFRRADLRCAEMVGARQLAPYQLAAAHSLRFIKHLEPAIAGVDPIRFKLAFDPA